MEMYITLILTPSLYTHEQLKSYKSLEAYNQVLNGWVRDVVYTVCGSSSSKFYLFTALVKHSQSLPWRCGFGQTEQWNIVCSLHMYGWCWRNLLSYCLCAVYIRFKYSNEAAVLMHITSVFMATKSVPLSEIIKIDFTTPKQKHKQVVAEDCGEPSSKNKKLAVTKSTDSDLATFHNEISQGTGKPVMLSLMAEYNDSHVPENICTR